MTRSLSVRQARSRLISTLPAGKIGSWTCGMNCFYPQTQSAASLENELGWSHTRSDEPSLHPVEIRMSESSWLPISGRLQSLNLVTVQLTGITPGEHNVKHFA